MTLSFEKPETRASFIWRIFRKLEPELFVKIRWVLNAGSYMIRPTSIYSWCVRLISANNYLCSFKFSECEKLGSICDGKKGPFQLKWWNPAKHHKKKAPNKGRGKETKGLDQSPGKQTAHELMNHSKYWNFQQSHEAYQVKKGEVSLIKLQA
jgi:hypothetical protein